MLYVTERCVFELKPEGLTLVEIAPGIDVERDILSRMAFRPIVGDLREMDGRIFRDEPLDLRTDLLKFDLASRVALDPESNRLFLNFENMRVRSTKDVACIRAEVERVCAPLGHPVDVVVNYDGFRLDEDVAADYAAMAADLEDRRYGKVTRYSGSAFLRMKLGATLRAARLFETREQAQAFLDRGATAGLERVR